MTPVIVSTETLRAECPDCQTSYALARLGLKTIGLGQTATVLCVTCKGAFSFYVQSHDVVETTPAPWWRVWNRRPDGFGTRQVLSTHSTPRT